MKNHFLPILKKHAEEGKCDSILVKDTNRHEAACYSSQKCFE